METYQQLLDLVGTQGSRNMILIDGDLMTPEMFVAQYAKALPEELNRVTKEARVMVQSWTWKKQYTRFSPTGWTVVKTNIKVEPLK